MVEINIVINVVINIMISKFISFYKSVQKNKVYSRWHCCKKKLKKDGHIIIHNSFRSFCKENVIFIGITFFNSFCKHQKINLTYLLTFTFLII